MSVVSIRFNDEEEEIFILRKVLSMDEVLKTDSLKIKKI